MHDLNPAFACIDGDTVRRLVFEDLEGCVRTVRDAYAAHESGKTVNPASVFLRFPERPRCRIIALPAHLGDRWQVSGMKWIASYPENVQRGIPRASAVLILNDGDTGYPFACLEASVISAMRTAASAALAAHHLHSRDHRAKCLGIIGTGLIARHVFRVLQGTGWQFDEVRLYDHDRASAESLAARIRTLGFGGRVTVTATNQHVLAESDLIVFATTAVTPHVQNKDFLASCPTVLHLSLRDLSPEVVMAANNVVDDVEHVMSAGTSVHLAEQASGSRGFVTGSLAALMNGQCSLEPGKATIFSPFGLGILDVAVGAWIYERASASGALMKIPNFFGDLQW